MVPEHFNGTLEDIYGFFKILTIFNQDLKIEELRKFKKTDQNSVETCIYGLIYDDLIMTYIG